MLTGQAPISTTSSRGSALLAVSLVVSLVAAVVLGAALLSRPPVDRAASSPSAPAAPTVTPSVVVPTTRSIEMSSSHGAGLLVVVSHSWTSTGGGARSRLRVTVELSCSRGRIDYDPYFFQVFDASGRLYEADSGSDAAMESGQLRPGQKVRGTVSFILPRGNVTLLMSDLANQSVTALRIAG